MERHFHGKTGLSGCRKLQMETSLSGILSAIDMVHIAVGNRQFLNNQP
jgi:hypothetical protein